MDQEQKRTQIYPKMGKHISEIHKKLDQDKGIRIQNDQESPCPSRWRPFKLQSEKSEDKEIKKLSSKESWNLYDILTKIKESLFSSVVQVFSTDLLDPTTNWRNIVTGVACLTRAQEHRHFLQVGSNLLRIILFCSQGKISLPILFL